MAMFDAACSPAAGRSAEVAQILDSAEQFSEAAIPALEGHLQAQIADGTYDMTANKALVKLYQFFPLRCDRELLARALIKAMMARPAADSTMLLFIAPEALAEGTPLLRRINKCDALLEASKFAEFWACASTEDEGVKLVDVVPGFAPAVRRFVLGLLSQTFESCPLELFVEALGVTEAEAKAMAAKPPADSVLVPAPKGSALAHFALNADNQEREQRFSKPVQLSSLLSLYNQNHDNVFKAFSKRQ